MSFLDKVKMFFTNGKEKCLDSWKRFKIWVGEKYRNLKSRFSKSS